MVATSSPIQDQGFRLLALTSLLALWLLVISTGGAPHSVQYEQTPSQRRLPHGPLILGYGTNCKDSQKMIDEAVMGVNVIIWFATSLVSDHDGAPLVAGGQDPACVARVAKTLRDRGLETTHLISIGGWDAPHPNTSWTGEEWAQTWMKWNREQVAMPSLGFDGFDGVDWDLEGNDAVDSPWNKFSPACMHLVGTMSQRLKDAGFLVSLVPPQSYLDVTTSRFDRSLTHAYPGYHPEFAYHGFNAYALWLAKYGRVNDGRPTFDIVDVQLYETFSRAGEAIIAKGMAPHEYLCNWVRALQRGWRVDFSSDPEVDFTSTIVKVSASQLVVGLSHGSSKPPHSRSLFIDPSDVALAWQMLAPQETPRGLMFWNMENDGKASWLSNGTVVNVSFAAAFNRILNVRR